MFRNHLKTSFRLFSREKSFTVINVVGLTAGIWCSLLISLWIQDEMSFDKFHVNGKNIYHLLRNVKEESGNIHTQYGTAYPIGEELVKDFPEIEASVRLSASESMVLKIGEDYVEQKVAAADPNFFQVFSFPIVQGNPGSCLQELNYIVISSELADSHFKGRSAIGETVTINQGPYSIDFQVGGVFERPAGNSTISFDAVLPIENYLAFNTTYESWGNSWLETYILLDPKATQEVVNKKIADVPEQKGKADWFTLYLHPLQQQYLYSEFSNGQATGGRIDNVILFALIGLFTVLIACFNFINLSTARAAKRSVGIGIRKVIGAGKAVLIAQFMIESLLLVLMSVAIAVLLSHLSLPYFSELTSKEILVDYFHPGFYMLVSTIIGAVLLFSGLYPAVFLASFKPVKALKKSPGAGSSHSILRKLLVTFQFGLAIVLVAVTLTVLMQMKYLGNKHLGLEKENIIYVPLDFKTGPNYEAIKAELTNHVSIQAVSASATNFANEIGASSDPVWRKKTTGSLKWFAIMNVRIGLLEMLGIQLEEGRYFSGDLKSDTSNYIINRRAADAMGFEDPVGETLELWGNKGKIIGVTKDFNFTSLHHEIQPTIIRVEPFSDLLFVKTSAGKTLEAIDHLQTVLTSFTSLPVSYHFLDETLENSYRQERMTQKLATWFSAFAIIITCLGLLGLASYTAERRAREFAIRRVLGAGLMNVLRLLFKEYLVLIAIGFAIGVPVAWYWMRQWLSDFAYRIDIQWWFFALPALLVVVIAALTISRLSVKTARTNPVEHLRNE